MPVAWQLIKKPCVYNSNRARVVLIFQSLPNKIN